VTSTTDYTTKPYAGWLEEVLPEMVELDPVSIGIVMIMPDGMTGTCYFNVDREDMEIMKLAISDDQLVEFFKVNADVLTGILSGEEDEADEEQGTDTETDSEG